VDVDPLLDRRPLQLSGGERKRAAIAQALLSEPRVLLMDEPLAGIDQARKGEIVPYLERLRDELAIPVVYVTHALDEVARLASHVVLFDRGRAVADGPAADVLSRLDLPTADADDAGVVIDGAIAAHDAKSGLTEVRCDGGSLWVGQVDRPLGAPLRVRVLARDVSLALAPVGPSSILNVLPARVVEVADRGPLKVHVRLSLGDGGAPLLARITRRSQEALNLAAGAAVYAMVKSVALLA
jgi:molybdate transport system ATP-binding protein